MVRKWWIVAALAGQVLLAQGSGQSQQDRRPRIDVEHYAIQAQIDPVAQSVTATVEVRFTPLDASVQSAVFELNNAMNVSRVVDGAGRQISASRYQQDFTVRLGFPEAIPKGKQSSVTFTYDGKLTGQEESPVYGIKFGAIHPEFAYLMYPSRWFPVNDYTADRFSADLKITVPKGFTVLASGSGKSEGTAPDKTTWIYSVTQASFPGSIAVVKGDPVRASTASVFFRESKDMSQQYGEETGKQMEFFTALYGLPPQANLTLVETEAGTPNGYSAPGLIFLSPRAIGKQLNTRALSNQVARQWWGGLVSPANRNHLWLANGTARYSELLYLETAAGPGALDAEIHDTNVEALTVETPPVMQAAKLEDYSPEYWAVTAAKGASVLHMLRYLMGNDNFMKLLKEFPQQYAWKGITTEDFRKTAEKITGQNLDYFFLQWIESTGAPEFKLEYTVFRTQKGFRVMGKISQDLDTFRMPVDLKIETEGNPEEKRIEVAGTSSEFVIDTFGKPKRIEVDPNGRVLRYSPQMRVAVAIRRGEMFAEVSDFGEALKEYQKALDVNRNSSLAHYRIGEVFFLQNNYQSAANEFRESLNGDLEPKWTEVWSHINLGKIFDATGQRERAVNEYNMAVRTKDNTQGALEEAAKFLKKPYERQRPQA